MNHLFISYSHDDFDSFVRQFRQDLRDSGLSIWIDESELRTGTANWETAIRDAIENAKAVILVATPSAARSCYVQHELALARLHGRTVFPVWAFGADHEWPNCAPMGYISTQYIDLRGGGERYINGLQQLIHDLDAAIPPLAVFSADKVEARDVRNPYKGLAPFTFADRDDFFGREGLSVAIVERMQHIAEQVPRFLTLVGASGSGKSSLAMAGILPLIDELPGWTILDRITPSTHPLRELRKVLAPYLPHRTQTQIRDELEDGRAEGLYFLADDIVRTHAGIRVVLFIDQFEELFTLTIDEAERRQFIDLLTIATMEPDTKLLVLATIRIDFLHYPLSVERFRELFNGPQLQTVPAMTFSELIMAITEPAIRSNLDFEPGLVFEMVYQLSEDRQGLEGALPLLQFTLERLYNERDEHTLTLTAYRTMGGVQGAIGAHAEEVYCQLDETAQKALESVFLPLVNVDKNGALTRKRASLNCVAASEPARQLVDALISNRLLVTGAPELADESETLSNPVPTVELAHEMLLRSWDRLAVWLDTISDDLRIRDEVEQAARVWNEAGRPDYLLWPHERLAPVYAMERRLQITFDEISSVFISPETKRLVDEFRRAETPEHRKLTIIDRWAAIGSAAIEVMLQVIPLVELNDPENPIGCALIKALKPFKQHAVEQLSEYALHSFEEAAVNATRALYQLWEAEAGPYLITVLKSPHSDARCVAVEALGQVGYLAAAEPLVNVLIDDDYFVARRAAAEALGKLSESTTIQPLVEALINDSDYRVRCAAAESLGQMNEPIAVQPLLSALTEDNDNDVKCAAAKVLGQLGDPAASEPLLSALTEDDNPRVRYAAAEALGCLRDPTTVEPLTKLLNSDRYYEVRRAVVETLGELGDPSAVQSLAQTLRSDRSHEVRCAVAKVLGQLGDPIAVEPLVNALSHDSKDEVQHAIIKALGQLGDPAAVQPLTNVISSIFFNKGELKCAAAEALGQLDAPTAIKPLLDALTHSDSRFRYAVANVFEQLDNPIFTHGLLDFLATSKDNFANHIATRTLIRLSNSKTVPILIDKLISIHVPICCVAADILGQLGDPAAVEPLIDVLTNGETPVRAAAAGALGRLGNSTAAQPLVKIFTNDSDKYVRYMAAHALGQLEKSSAVIQPLIDALTDEREDIRCMATEILGQLKDDIAVQPLVKTMKDDPDCYVRRSAADALGNLGNHAAMQPLIDALASDDGFLRRIAVIGLARLGDSTAVQPLVDIMISESDVYMRRAAASALGYLGDLSVAPILISVLTKESDVFVRCNAAEALGQLKDHTAMQPLVESLTNNKLRLRLAAMNALVQLGNPATVPNVIPLLEDTIKFGLLKEERICDCAASLLEQFDTFEAREALAQWQRAHPQDYVIWQQWKINIGIEIDS